MDTLLRMYIIMCITNCPMKLRLLYSGAGEKSRLHLLRRSAIVEKIKTKENPMRKTNNKPDRNSREYLFAQLAGGRYALLLILIFTLVNLLMVMLDADRYFLFSASVPYYLTLFGKAMDNGFSDGAWEVTGAYTNTALIISAVILLVYFLCWFMSRKKPGWLTAALVLFVLDSSALVLFTYVLYGSPMYNIMDIFLHGWGLWQLFQAVKSHKKLKEMPAGEPADPGPEA